MQYKYDEDFQSYADANLFSALRKLNLKPDISASQLDAVLHYSTCIRRLTFEELVMIIRLAEYLGVQLKRSSSFMRQFVKITAFVQFRLRRAI